MDLKETKEWMNTYHDMYIKEHNKLISLRERMREKQKANLGCATTRELLAEIKARIEVNGQLDYRTIDSE